MTRILLGLIVYLYLLVVLGIAAIGQVFAFYSDEERVSGVINIGKWELEDKKCLLDNCGDCDAEEGLEDYVTDCMEANDLESKVDDFSEPTIEDAKTDELDVEIIPHSDGIEHEVDIKVESEEELQPLVKGNK